MIKGIWRKLKRTVSVLSQVSLLSIKEVIVVETYIKDPEDGDMLMDMMSANAGFERTVAKRGENIYPEVPPLLLLLLLSFSPILKNSISPRRVSKQDFNQEHYIPG